MDGSDAGEIGGHGGHGDHHGGHGHGHGDHGGAGYGVHSDFADATHGEGGVLLTDRAPVTWLPVGIDGGFTYVKETFMHAQTFGHAASANKAVPKGTLPTAKVAETMARMLGGVDALHHYGKGYLFEHPSFRTMARPLSGDDPGRKLNQPGLARSATTIELLAWPHGQCTPMEETRLVLARLGLSRLDLRQSSSLPDIEKMERKLLSANPFAGVDDGMNPANGWFRSKEGDKPQGKTWLWREFWQIKGCGVPFLGKPTDHDLHGTFLAVFGATWFFEHSGDYETRIAFAVYGLPYVPNGHETFKWNVIRAHRVAAEKAAATMVQYFGGFKAAPSCFEKRKRVPLQNLEPEAPRVRSPFEELAPSAVAPVLGGGRPGDPPGPEADEVR